MTITFTERIDGSRWLLPFLSDLGSADNSSQITLDFRNLRKVTPGGLVTLSATVNRWRREGRQVTAAGLDRCAITGYLQRMDLFEACGISLPESFARHNSSGSFVPIHRITYPVDDTCAEMALCLAPDGDDYLSPLSDLFDAAWYVLSETTTNVCQHSWGNGFAAAQVNRREGFVRLAVADNGIGIRQSFQNRGFGWQDTPDEEAIMRALQPRMSSRGRPDNEGVGLTLICEWTRLAQGWLLLVSGEGVVEVLQGAPPVASRLPRNGFYHGTFIALVFKHGIQEFPGMLTAAKRAAGLLP